MNKIFSLLIYICFFNVSAQGFDNAKLDQYLKSLDVNERAMLSVAIVQNGQPIYQNSIGFVDVLTKQRANENTQYQIGSITKVFTSTMIFQLIDEGKLSLNTKLAKFYPKIKNSEEITISMLLSHRSGIHNFTDSPDFNRFKVRSKTKDEMISLIESLGSDFRPDSRANYSNSGYVLLGFIIEDVTQENYAHQLEKRISSKINLKKTIYGGQISIRDNQAKSYIRKGNDWLLASVTDASISGGAGAISSTPTEVALFLHHLFAGNLISADSLAKMKDINQRMGRGLFQFTINDKKSYGHYGTLDGFSSSANIFEANDVSISIISNGLNYPRKNIIDAIVSIYFGSPYDIPDFGQKTIELSKSDLRKYEGVFISKEVPFKLILKLENDQLTAQATGQKRALNLTPFSTSDFRFDPAGIVIIFNSDSSIVDFSTFQLKQGGGSYTFIRE
tara:strand:- start:1953 stop:3293 length:1341 start_codon:yes stop_codon:yes gene_type:complete